MVVRPSTTTCGPTSVPAPRRTCGPISENALTLTSASRSAPAAMIAEGWMRVPLMPPNRCAAADGHTIVALRRPPTGRLGVGAASPPRLFLPRVVAGDDLFGEIELGRAVQHAAARLLEDHAVAVLLAELLDHHLQF